MSLSKPSTITNGSLASNQPPLRSEFAPLSAADFNSASFLTDILGLSPSSNTSRGSLANQGRSVVKTLQCGEFKYPDVTSPLNRILCKNRFTRNELGTDGNEMARSFNSFSTMQPSREGERSVFSTPDSGLYQQYRNSFETEESTPNQEGSFPLPSRSPSFTPQSGLNLGFGSSDVGLPSKPVELSRGLSPQSDVGYGTSFDSTESRAQSLRRDIDIDGLSELLRNISMNTSTMKIPGSPLASSNVSKSFYGDNLNILQNPGLTYFDPAVAQAAMQSIHHHHSHTHPQEQAFLQNLHSLQQYMNSGSSGSGRTSTVETPDHLLDEHFGRVVNHQPFQSRGYGPGFGTGSNSPLPDELDEAARNHRSSAAVNSATCTWSGQLPSRSDICSSPLSCKVFLGGVPWDISEQTLVAHFKPYGNIRVEWPNRGPTTGPRGYLYIIFENEKQVRSLLNDCTHDFAHDGSWYYKIHSRKSKNEEVQVIPWVIADSSCMRGPSQQIDPKKTVFVGALHGTLNAEGLCNIFNDLFGGVVYASVDTDKYKYPIGSGRVAFNNIKSYMKALAAAFIEIRTQKFAKKVQVDPYLEDALCSACTIRQGPYFCRDFTCFKYFCHTCWESNHSSESQKNHKTLMRNPRTPVSPKTGSQMFPAGFGYNFGIQNHYD